VGADVAMRQRRRRRRRGCIIHRAHLDELTHRELVDARVRAGETLSEDGGGRTASREDDVFYAGREGRLR